MHQAGAKGLAMAIGPATLRRMLDKTGGPKEREPATMRERFDDVVARTDAVCRQHLNEEYAQLCRRMAAALSRKRPSPLQSGQAESWACGIVHAVGSVNFLFDRSQKPHLTAQQLCALFGVSQSNAAAKAGQIRKILDLMPFHPEWSLPSKMEDNPLVWMISVNGLIMDVRMAPREVQEVAFEQGLIPYVPGDRRA